METTGHLWTIGYDTMERADEVEQEIVRLGWDRSDLILEGQSGFCVSDGGLSGAYLASAIGIDNRRGTLPTPSAESRFGCRRTNSTNRSTYAGKRGTRIPLPSRAA